MTKKNSKVSAIPSLNGSRRPGRRPTRKDLDAYAEQMKELAKEDFIKYHLRMTKRIRILLAIAVASTIGHLVWVIAWVR